jgi:hypothetical protein
VMPASAEIAFRVVPVSSRSFSVLMFILILSSEVLINVIYYFAFVKEKYIIKKINFTQ